MARPRVCLACGCPDWDLNPRVSLLARLGSARLGALLSSLLSETRLRVPARTGVPILVGRNRKENEQLSLRVAREPDVWMHVRGVPGAHVLLQMSRVKGKEPPAEECMQMAAVSTTLATLL